MEDSPPAPNNAKENTRLTLGPITDNSILCEEFGMMERIQHILGRADSDFIAELKSFRASIPASSMNQYSDIAE